MHCVAAAAQMGGVNTIRCLRNTLSATVRTLTKASKTLRVDTREHKKELRDRACADAQRTPAGSVTLSHAGRTLEEASHVWRTQHTHGGVNQEHPAEYVVRDLFWNATALPEARISLIEGFVSDAECAAFMEKGRPRLHAATHAGEDGNLHTKSKARDAQQVGAVCSVVTFAV